MGVSGLFVIPIGGRRVDQGTLNEVDGNIDDQK